MQADDKLISIIDDAILEYGFTDYAQLKPETKSKLTACMLADFDAELVFTNEDQRLMTSWVRYLTTETTKNGVDLANALRDAAIEHFAPKLASLFAERLSTHEFDRYREHGFRPIVYHDNGEIRWVR